jgi:hypothetical protein
MRMQGRVLLSLGSYPALKLDETSPEILVEEDIRQMLIFKQYSSKYFLYVRLFRDQCLSNYVQQKFSEQCATSVMNKL